MTRLSAQMKITSQTVNLQQQHGTVLLMQLQQLQHSQQSPFVVLSSSFLLEPPSLSSEDPDDSDGLDYIIGAFSSSYKPP